MLHQQTSDKSSTLDSEPILLFLGMPQPLRPLLEISNDEWEDLCQACGGWEWIDGEARGKNRFGENVGLDRLKEALEANEWDGRIDDTQTDDDLENELGLGDRKLRDWEPELETDGAGMHDAILMHDNKDKADIESDMQVQELENMMLKMQAIKGLLAFMSLSLSMIAYVQYKSLLTLSRQPCRKRSYFARWGKKKARCQSSQRSYEIYVTCINLPAIARST